MSFFEGQKNLKPLKSGTLPEAPLSIRKMIGPSFVLLGLGLGSGELILWPYLSGNYGLGIIWGALLGITMQFFLNMEIERYTLVNGESVFVGFARIFKYLPFWFIFSTLAAWLWPGLVGSSAKIITHIIGFGDYRVLGIILLLFIGSILTLSKVIYKTIEKVLKYIILISIPLIIIIVLIVAKSTDYLALMKGLVGVGKGYFFIPLGFPLMTFLGALAYAGAGGNLNLAQSFYIKEKSYGMGKYSSKITSLITAKNIDKDTILEGTTFDETNNIELNKFNQWWKLINKEHFLVFWGGGLFTILLLSLLSYSTVHNKPNIVDGLNFIFMQADTISSQAFPLLGIILMLITASMLLTTQLGVFDACCRVIAENVAIIKKEDKNVNISKVYFAAVWTFVLLGIIVFLSGFNEPKLLVITSAVINAVCMFVYSGIFLRLNTKYLPKNASMKLSRKLAITFIFLFFGIFSILVFYDKVF